MFTLPAVAGITAVVKEYANLEQSIGGVETLFKKSAKAVQKMQIQRLDELVYLLMSTWSK